MKAKWKLHSLGHVVSDGFQNGLYRPASDYGTGVPIIRINDFNNDGQLSNHVFERVRLTDEEISRFELRAGDILINRVNSLTHIGKSVVVPELAETTVYESNMMRLRLDGTVLDAAFAAQYMQQHRTRDFFRKVAKRAVAQASINQDDVKSLPIPDIILPEQQKIAAILSTWDRAIELTEKLIAAKQKRKQVLMQQLLTGKVRLRGFEKNAWKKCHLGDVAKNSTRRNGTSTDQATVYSVTNSVGMIPMDAGVIGESIDRYKTVSRFDFAYNPMRINVGSIAMWEGDEDVLVSPDYVVYRCGQKLNAKFLNHFRKTHYWRHFVNRAGGGSVRVRIYFSDLAAMKLNLPPVEEQRAIAAVLNAQDAEIRLLGCRLDALKQQKKGLMQQLLTGKVRVNVGDQDLQEVFQ